MRKSKDQGIEWLAEIYGRGCFWLKHRSPFRLYGPLHMRIRFSRERFLNWFWVRGIYPRHGWCWLRWCSYRIHPWSPEPPHVRTKWSLRRMK